MAATTDINIVSVSGNLTRDSEFKTVGQSGVVNFSVAVNESQKNQDGTWGSYANYLDVSYFSKGAQKLSEMLKKGTPVVVQGHLHQDRWEKDGQKNSRLVIRADNIKLCGGRQNGQGNQNGEFKEDLPFGNDGNNGGIPF